jgi:hypothetical protein
MKELLALMSTLSNKPGEAVLASADSLCSLLDRFNPLCIAKVSARFNPSSSWEFYIEECGRKMHLLSSEELENNPEQVELIKELGHRIILIGNQKLIVYSSLEMESCACFADISRLIE